MTEKLVIEVLLKMLAEERHAHRREIADRDSLLALYRNFAATALTDGRFSDRTREVLQRTLSFDHGEAPAGGLAPMFIVHRAAGRAYYRRKTMQIGGEE